MREDEGDIEVVVDSEEVKSSDEAIDIDEELSDDGTRGEDEEQDYLDVDESNDSVASALRGNLPLYLLHRSHQHSQVLPAVVENIARRHGDELSLGVIAPMPRMTPDGLRSFLDRFEYLPIRIADPEAFARMDSLGAALHAQRQRPYVGRTADHWRYFTERVHSGGDSGWVRRVLDSQRSAGATLLLTPGVWADPASPGPALSTTRAHADWARSDISQGEELGVSITLTAPWLTTVGLRDRLLNEILDMDEDVFYLRARWPLLPHPYGQLLDESLLDAYAEVSNVLDENDKVLLLPNTGLTGWLALSWGAHGFSTGIGTGERAFADTRVIRIPANRPRPIPTPRYFTNAILHVTDFSTARLLDALPNARPCRCTFCRRMSRRGYDKALSGAHYLRRVADATAAIAVGDGGRRLSARRIVRQARAFAAAAASHVPLVDSNDPRHLGAWASRLR